MAGSSGVVSEDEVAALPLEVVEEGPLQAAEVAHLLAVEVARLLAVEVAHLLVVEVVHSVAHLEGAEDVVEVDVVEVDVEALTTDRSGIKREKPGQRRRRRRLINDS